MSPITQKKSPARWAFLFGTAFVACTASLASFLALSYAGAAPSSKSPAPAAASAASAAPTAAASSVALERALGLSEAFVQVAERVSPSVVTIKVESRSEQPAMFGGAMPFFFGQPTPRGGESGVVRGSGSGVIFRGDGAVLTNNHVIENARRITVMLKDGRSFRASVAGTDPAVDLAVLKIDAKNLPAATFADSSKARVGEWVLAIGAPFGLDYTTTAGVLSAKGRGVGANEIEDYLQTDASINPGNSGGPLVDLRGEVLGINTMIIGRASGIGFAIPANLVRSVGEQLLGQGEVKRAWLGVSFQELSPELAESLGKKDTHGALVASVVGGGPAERAGLRPGDVIETIDADAIVESKDLLRAVLRRPVGGEVKLGVLRDGKKLAVSVKTGQRPRDAEHAQLGLGADGDAGAKLGLELSALTPELADQLDYRGQGKVVVSGVRPGSDADDAGLARGDVIVEADRRAVQSPRDVASALSDGKALLRVDRRGGSLFVVLRKSAD